MHISRCEKLTTIKEEQLMATHDQIGDTKTPQWKKTPATIGMIIML